MKKLFITFSTIFFITACAPTIKLMPVDLEVAADLPTEAALGWLEKMPRDMKCCVTPAYPLPCEYSEDGIITSGWEGFPPRKSKNNAVRPWKDFITRPGNTLTTQYSVSIYNEGTTYQNCRGQVGLETLDEKEMCTAYFSAYLVNGQIDMKRLDCKTVTREVEKTLTALKAMGVTVVPQAP